MPNPRDFSTSRAPNEPERLREYAQWDEGGDAGLAGANFEKLHAELQGEIAREKGVGAWLRSRPTPVRALVAGLVVGALALVTMGVWGRQDFAMYPAERMLAVVASIAGLIVVDLVLVLWPLQLPAAPQWLMAAAVAGAPLGLLFWYSAPAVETGHPGSVPVESAGTLVRHALHCLVFGSVIAGGIYGLLRGLDRGGANRLLLMGACAGLAGNLMLQLHCSVTAPVHLLIGHLGVVVLCFAFAFWRERVSAA
jgi:hypothetical protein